MLFSIIVPVHDSEAMLDRCLQSILNQNFRDYELILCENGSKDQSLDICKKYAFSDSRITVLHSDIANVSHARNMGMASAKGEYILFADSDDYFLKDALSLFKDKLSYEWLVTNITSDHDLSSTDRCFEISNEDYMAAMMDDANEYDRVLKEFQYHAGSLAHVSSKVYVNQVIRQYHIHFDEAICISEDLLFNMEYVSHIKKITILDHPAYFYTHNPAGVSKKAEISSIKQRIILITYLMNMENTYEITIRQNIVRLFIMASLLRYSVIKPICDDFLKQDKVKPYLNKTVKRVTRGKLQNVFYKLILKLLKKGNTDLVLKLCYLENIVANSQGKGFYIKLERKPRSL